MIGRSVEIAAQTSGWFVALERKWWTLLVVCVATFMYLLDMTIVNVALPRIAAGLHASFADIQWVLDAYALTLASLLLTGGALADLRGRRLVFCVGLGMFSLASLLCALAPSAPFLIVARGGQGIGGAMMMATSLALIAQEFQGPERGTAFGVWGATVGGATAVGPLLGGSLTQAFGWSAIFYINVPIGVAVILLTRAKVRESHNPGGTRIDWIGTASFSAALFLLVFALIRGNAEGWGSTVIVALLAGSAALLILFLLAELRQEHAMLDLSLFAKPTFDGAAVVAFALSASIFAMFLYLTLYMQTLLGLSPLQTGVRFLPVTIMSFAVAAASGKLAARVPARLLLSGGLVLAGAGMMLMRGLTGGSHWSALLPGFIVAGVGIGLVNPALASTAIGVVTPARSGMASGINATFRQVGMATGIAALGAIFQSTISSQLASQLAGTPLASHATQIAHAITGGGPQRTMSLLPADSFLKLGRAIDSSFAGAMNEILLVAGLVTLAGAGLATMLVHGDDLAALRAPRPVPTHADAD